MNSYWVKAYLTMAAEQLDYLDPIIGFDILAIRETEPFSIGKIHSIYTECLNRANVHAPGTLRQAWNNVLDCLSEANKLILTPKAKQ